MDILTTDIGSPLSSSAFANGSPKRAHTPGGSFVGTLKGEGSQVLGMAGGSTIRSQLDSLAKAMHDLDGRVELQGRTIVNLEEDRDRMKQVIQTQDNILNQRILSECGSVAEDMNHKFALQIAENKRLQAQLAKAAADIQRLTRMAENLATRVQILEANTGVQ